MEISGIVSLPFLIIMVVIGPIGNFLIIYYFIFVSQRQCAYHLFLVHLGIVDMLACILIPLLFLPQVMVDGQWFLGELACKYLFHIPVGLTVYSSCWVLFGIIVDRYRAIVHPLAARFTPRTIHLYCGIIWLVSLAQVIPMHMSDNVVVINNKTRCVEVPLSILPREGEALFVTSNSIIQWIAPVVLIAFFLRRTRRSLSHATRFSERSHSINTQQRYNKNKNVMRLLKKTLSIYVFTLTINNVSTIVKTIMRSYYPRVWQANKWLDVATAVGIHIIFINNVVNCFIYAGAITPFRDYVIRLFPFVNNYRKSSKWCRRSLKQRRQNASEMVEFGTEF